MKRMQVAAAVLAAAVLSTASAAFADGAALFDEHCASCHAASVPRAPHLALLGELPYDTLLAAMTSGSMREQAAALSDDDRKAVAAYLTRNQPATTSAKVGFCDAPLTADIELESRYAGWSTDLRNTRSLDATAAGMTSVDVGRLELRWAFAYPNANRARSQPLVIGSLVVVGSQDGTVYALDRSSGCARWTFRASAEVRNGVTPLKLGDGDDARWYGFFSDFQARAYAVDLVTGSLVWKAVLDEHPAATGSGQAAAFEDTVYFPVSSVEVGLAADPGYRCCTFRGSVVALDAATGERRWQRYTIDEEPALTGTNSADTETLGPSGAPVWSTPTIDVPRRRLYVGTGQNYSVPATATSDAILALDLDSGEVNWVRQTTAGDVWTAACIEGFGDPANCPDPPGPDLDFGAPPVLASTIRGDVLAAGQKSGMVYGLDPDDGSIRWQQRVGRGGVLGGVHFGMAAAKGRIFVPINDSNVAYTGDAPAEPGLTALDAGSGRRDWRRRADTSGCTETECNAGISAPVTAAGDLVFAGYADGVLRAHDAASGAVRFEYATAREFDTVGGDVARGGGMGGGSGPVVVDGWVFVNSGYYMVLHSVPGNVLLAFAVAADKEAG